MVSSWFLFSTHTKSHIKETSVRRSFVFNWWRENSSGLGNEQPRGLYSSLNIIQVVTSKRMKWAGHVTCMGERSGAYGVLVEKPE